MDIQNYCTDLWTNVSVWMNLIYQKIKFISDRISEIVSMSPFGLTKSSLTRGSSPNQWYVNISWTPGESQSGAHLFCLSAVDSERWPNLGHHAWVHYSLDEIMQLWFGKVGHFLLYYWMKKLLSIIVAISFTVYFFFSPNTIAVCHNNSAWLCGLE